MNFDFNFIATFLFVIGLANLLLALVLFQRIGGVGKWFSLLMFCISVWSIAYSFELASNNLAQMLFFIKIEYVGICFLPAIWIIFIIKFINKNEWLTKLNYLLIAIFSIIDFLLVITNEQHHLHYETVSVDLTDQFPLLSIEPGIAYNVHTVYFYFMLVFGIVLLLNNLKKDYAIYKKQYIAIILAAFIPWVVNFFYLLGFKPLGHVDLTPFAFIITSVTISFSLLRHSLFNLIPIARGKVIENMTEGVLVLDWQFRILDLNSIIVTYFNRPSNSIIGLNFFQLIEPNANLNDQLIRNFTKPIIIHTHGSYFEISVNDVNESKGIYKGYLLILRDITESKLANEKLEQQAKELVELNKLKDKMFSIIAHDLKAPFANLINLLQIVGDESLSIDDFKELIPKLSESVTYTSTMIENLLNWSRSQINAINITKEEILFTKIIGSEISFFSKKALEKGITIHNNVPLDLNLYTDSNIIQLVFRNLFSNAIKFCNSGDSINLKLQLIDGVQTIVFEDSGVGISEDKVNKLFGVETFSTFGTNNEKGTGLGLLLCKDFIEKLGGKIWVKSIQGKGTIFYVQV